MWQGLVLSPGHPAVYCSRTLHPQFSASVSPGFILGLCYPWTLLSLVSVAASSLLPAPWSYGCPERLSIVLPLCARLKPLPPFSAKLWPAAARHHELFPCYFPARALGPRATGFLLESGRSTAEPARNEPGPGRHRQQGETGWREAQGRQRWGHLEGLN